MRAAKNAAKKRDLDELVDADVPATVVCAHCGDADCPGCRHEQTQSGVVAVIAWERPGTPALAGLWVTAYATTFDADRFFESMPDGPIAPALRFAVASELIASAAMATFAALPLAIFAPNWFKHVLVDEGGALARVLCAGIPGLAAFLVAAHVAHGWALDLGARRAGARGATTRALRFGLYSTGWDVITGPLGAIAVAFKQGLRVALSVAGVATGLPGRSARAFLRGCYHLEGAAAQPALRASYIAAMLATAVGTVVIIGAILAALLL